MHKRTLIRGMIVLLFGCLISLYSVACNPQQPTKLSSSSQPLEVSISPWIGYRGHYLAMAKKLFEAEGITVKERTFQATTDVMTAMAANKVDMAWIGGADVLGLANEIPSLRIIMASDYSNGGDGILGRNISTPAEMKGKKVAREDAPYAMVFLGTYLAKAGLTEKDLTVVSLSAGDAAAAFLAGKVDAATTYEPYLTQAKANIIFTSKDTNAIPIVLMTRSELIKSRKDDLLSYLRAIDKGLAFASSNATEANEIIAKNLGVTPKDVPDQLAGIHPFDIASNKTEAFNPNHPLYLVKSLDSASKMLFDLKRIPKVIDAKTIVDDTLINALKPS